VRKKNGEIHICIDLHNLNSMSLKDNYPLPNRELLLQRVTGVEMLSILDGVFRVQSSTSSGRT
jgi:hypothetical protein